MATGENLKQGARWTRRADGRQGSIMRVAMVDNRFGGHVWFRPDFEAVERLTVSRFLRLYQPGGGPCP